MTRQTAQIHYIPAFLLHSSVPAQSFPLSRHRLRQRAEPYQHAEFGASRSAEKSGMATGKCGPTENAFIDVEEWRFERRVRRQRIIRPSGPVDILGAARKYDH